MAGSAARALLLRLRRRWFGEAGDEVGVVARVVHDLLARAELAGALAFLVLALQEALDVAIARLLEQLAELGDRPQAPLVGERRLDLAPVLETEVDVRLEVVGDGVEQRLVPDVAEALVL